ncbi:hypothetical protein J3F83DRAFT_44181 [Trichoderma novae-zelandiae]
MAAGQDRITKPPHVNGQTPSIGRTNFPIRTSTSYLVATRLYRNLVHTSDVLLLGTTNTVLLHIQSPCFSNSSRYIDEIEYHSPPTVSAHGNFRHPKVDHPVVQSSSTPFLRPEMLGFTHGNLTTRAEPLSSCRSADDALLLVQLLILSPTSIRQLRVSPCPVFQLNWTNIGVCYAVNFLLLLLLAPFSLGWLSDSEVSVCHVNIAEAFVYYTASESYCEPTSL